MTQVGHALTGMSIALIAIPRDRSRLYWLLAMGTFVVLAHLPDAPLPGWGHHRYDISHSVFVNGAMILAILTLAYLFPRGRDWLGGWIVVLAGAAAWLSHLLLDTFYNHGKGLAMFWPVSEARLALPIPMFSTLPGWHLDTITFTVARNEFLFFGLLLALSVLLRWWIQRIGERSS